MHRPARRADSSTKATTLGRVAQMNVTNGGYRAATFPDHALLDQMRQAQILIDVTVASAVLMLRVAPLPTISPFVVRRGAKQHGLRRRRTDAVAGDAAAGPRLVKPTFTENPRQRHAQFLVYREISTEQPDFSVLTVIPVHRAVTVLFVIGRYLIHRAAVHRFPIVAAHLDPLTSVTLRFLLLVTPAVRTVTVLLVRRRRQRFAGGEGPALKEPRAEPLSFLYGRRCVGQRLGNPVRARTALGHG